MSFTLNYNDTNSELPQLEDLLVDFGMSYDELQEEVWDIIRQYEYGSFVLENIYHDVVCHHLATFIEGFAKEYRYPPIIEHMKLTWNSNCRDSDFWISFGNMNLSDSLLSERIIDFSCIDELENFFDKVIEAHQTGN